jgi:hypothetical protein
MHLQTASRRPFAGLLVAVPLTSLGAPSLAEIRHTSTSVSQQGGAALRQAFQLFFRLGKIADRIESAAIPQKPSWCSDREPQAPGQTSS